MEETEKTAQNWESASTRISNTWTDTIGNVVNSDLVIGLLNGFNEILTLINKTTEALGTFGTVGLTGGAVAFIKNLD